MRMENLHVDSKLIKSMFEYVEDTERFNCV